MTVRRLEDLAEDEPRDGHNPNLCDLWLSSEPDRGCTCSDGDES